MLSGLCRRYLNHLVLAVDDSEERGRVFIQLGLADTRHLTEGDVVSGLVKRHGEQRLVMENDVRRQVAGPRDGQTQGLQAGKQRLVGI